MGDFTHQHSSGNGKSIEPNEGEHKKKNKTWTPPMLRHMKTQLITTSNPGTGLDGNGRSS